MSTQRVRHTLIHTRIHPLISFSDSHRGQITFHSRKTREARKTSQKYQWIKIKRHSLTTVHYNLSYQVRWNLYPLAGSAEHWVYKEIGNINRVNTQRWRKDKTHPTCSTTHGSQRMNHSHTRARARAHTHTHTHVRAHTHTHTHKKVCVCVCVCVCGGG